MYEYSLPIGICVICKFSHDNIFDFQCELKENYSMGFLYGKD